jgi:predicted ATP-grasp superfamily ATP-dependent carboligase
MIKWMMVVIFMTPGGDVLMKSYNEYSSEKQCVQELERARQYPHPFGIKVQMTCERMIVEKAPEK